MGNLSQSVAHPRSGQIAPLSWLVVSRVLLHLQVPGAVCAGFGFVSEQISACGRHKP